MNKKELHQGKLFKKLVHHLRKKQKEVEKLTGITPNWQREIYKMKVLSDKNITLICSGLKVDESYFQGALDLHTITVANDPQAEYQTLMQALEKENSELKNTIIKLQAELLEQTQKKESTSRVRQN